jgi:molecular chaperone DnaJ
MNTPIGYMRQLTPCQACSGIGLTYKNECTECKATGVQEIEETIEVEVPSGVLNNMTFVMAGKGYAIKGGETGDLHINLVELPHKVFTRVGKELKMSLNLTYTQLVLGDKIEIATIDGSRIRVTIPEYSDVGSNLRVPNKGTMVYLDKERGDLIITLGIKIPKKITQSTKDLLEKFRDSKENM